MTVTTAKTTTIDLDDFSLMNNRLDLLWQLKAMRPDFKMTAFAVPALGTSEFWESVPTWIELAVHGWKHPTPRECEEWDYHTMDKYMRRVHPRFVHGFKAPGWQISDSSYRWLQRHGWWVADQDYNDSRRPEDLAVYKVTGWHGHIQDVCGNGLVESWPQVVRIVNTTKEFRFASEMLQ